MGNEYMDSSDPAFLREDSTIAKYIKNFMLNNYKFMNSDEEIFKNFYKKKACCLGKNSIPFSLPSYNPESKKIVSSILKLKVFPNNNPDTFKNNCGEYTGLFDENSKKHISNNTCDIFYDKYCGNVYNERNKTYTNDSKFYGPYDIIPIEDNNILSKGNEFQDCNCLNSAFQKIPNINVDSQNIPKDNDTLAQTLDIHCSDSNSYIKKYSKNEGGCFNKITVDGVQNKSKYPALYANILRKCLITPDEIKELQKQLKNLQDANTLLQKAQKELEDAQYELINSESNENNNCINKTKILPENKNIVEVPNKSYDYKTLSIVILVLVILFIIYKMLFK